VNEVNSYHAKESPVAARVRRAAELARRAIAMRPEAALRTASTQATLTEGLRCEIAEGDFRLVADMSPKMGGEGAGPNPGVLGRGALAACIAMNVSMRAALLRVPIHRVHVRVEADYDARGEFIPGASDPGYQQLRVALTVESEAGEDAVQRVLDEALATTAFLDTFRRPVDVQVEAKIVASAREEAA
jgi:uncharacterized OsmC-like protein